jgi:hypothetical protein
VGGTQRALLIKRLPSPGYLLSRTELRNAGVFSMSTVQQTGIQLDVFPGMSFAHSHSPFMLVLTVPIYQM